MEATTWLDRQQDLAADAPASGAGAALPLVLWAIVLLATGGATALEQVPFWAFAALIASPALLLVLGLYARDLIAGLAARRRRESCC
jgi:hypothetical protein